MVLSLVFHKHLYLRQNFIFSCHSLHIIIFPIFLGKEIKMTYLLSVFLCNIRKGFPNTHTKKLRVLKFIDNEKEQSINIRPEK